MQCCWQADVDDKPFWLTVNEDVPLGSPIK